MYVKAFTFGAVHSFGCYPGTSRYAGAMASLHISPRVHNLLSIGCSRPNANITIAFGTRTSSSVQSPDTSSSAPAHSIFTDGEPPTLDLVSYAKRPLRLTAEKRGGLGMKMILTSISLKTRASLLAGSEEDLAAPALLPSQRLWGERGRHSEWVFTFVAKRTRTCQKTGQKHNNKRYPITYWGLLTHRRCIWPKAGVIARWRDLRIQPACAPYALWVVSGPYNGCLDIPTLRPGPPPLRGARRPSMRQRTLHSRRAGGDKLSPPWRTLLPKRYT